MQIFKIIAAIILFVALQGALSSFMERLEYVDLTLIITVYLSLKRNPMQGMLSGAGAGLAYDVVSGGPLLGAGSFTKTVIGFVLSSLNVHFAIDRKLMRLFILTVASAGNVLLFVGLYWVFNHKSPLVGSSTPAEIARLTAWQAGGNLILAFFLFPILDKVFADNPYTSGRKAAKW